LSAVRQSPGRSAARAQQPERVFVQVSDPVQAGFVSNIARPAGNITGFTTYEYSMVGKWLEVLKEVAPSITRVLVLLNPENGPQWEGYTKAIDAYARSIALQFVPGAVRDRREILRR
jgi:putative ABC transport system substrate-binding protein